MKHVKCFSHDHCHINVVIIIYLCLHIANHTIQGTGSSPWYHTWINFSETFCSPSKLLWHHKSILCCCKTWWHIKIREGWPIYGHTVTSITVCTATRPSIKVNKSKAIYQPTLLSSTFVWYVLTLIPVSIINWLRHTLWDEIIYSLPIFKRAIVEVWMDA